jgi:predicted CopG family antitoxin
MYMEIHSRVNVSLRRETRSLLSEIGKKNQSYDDVIKELLESKNKLNVLEKRLSVLPSSTSKSNL